MTLAVVVPHRDTPFVRRCIEAILTGSRRPDELIVVDDGSTAPLVDLPMDVRLLTQAHAGPAAARNVGARATNSDILVFVDADCEVLDGTLEALEAHFADTSVAAVQALYSADCPVTSVAARVQNVLQRENLLAVPDKEHFAGLSSFCVGIRREAFERAGGFDERIRRPTIEDENLGLALHALGFAIRIAPEVEVRHHARPTALGLCRRMARMAADRVRTLDLPSGKLGSHHRPEMLVATVFSTAAVSLALAPPLSLAAAGLSLFAQRRWLRAAANQHGPRFAVMAAPLLVALPASAGMGVLVGAASRISGFQP